MEKIVTKKLVQLAIPSYLDMFSLKKYVVTHFLCKIYNCIIPLNCVCICADPYFVFLHYQG